MVGTVLGTRRNGGAEIGGKGGSGGAVIGLYVGSMITGVGKPEGLLVGPLGDGTGGAEIGGKGGSGGAVIGLNVGSMFTSVGKLEGLLPADGTGDG